MMRNNTTKEEKKVKHRGDYPCQDCGTEDNCIWSTDNVFWNAVMDDFLVHNENCSGILCVNCFTIRAEEKFDCKWRLIPDWNWKEKHHE